MEDQAVALKVKGNAALAAGNFDEAIECYTEGIALDGKNYQLYSNRSAAYAQSNKFEEALRDAEKTIELKSDWAKGYSRKGSALVYLGRYKEAAEAYMEGLKHEPNNEQLKNALEKIQFRHFNSFDVINNAFKDPNLITKLKMDPRTRKCFDDPEYVKMIEELQKNPSLVQKKFNDPHIIPTLQVILGINISKDEKIDVDSPNPPPQEIVEEMEEEPPETKPAKEQSVTPEVKIAMEEKNLGNEAYKKRDFETALKHYFKAVELNPIEVTYYNNIAAVYFEQKDYKKCIEECEKAIEIGRENRADFKLIAKAFTRIGNAYKKLNDLYNAKIYFEKSMSEHRTPEIRACLAEVEKLIKEQERKAYIDPVKAEEEKEKGNELFKSGDYAEAVKHYTEAIKRNPDEAKYYSNRAACYTKLGAFDLGLKDCEMCLQLDPKFFKGWLRKGKILQGMKQHGKALAAYQKALDLDPVNEEALEGYRTCSVAHHSNPEEVRKRAMADPEIQAILQDPAMRLILEQMQNDPKALQYHLLNSEIAAKIQKLLESGLIVIR